ncbi:ribokinase [Bacillus sp. FJAT-50079]|uniref:ribokinase n=1 Tax=Bacillus sp. FJAT-50079 TaxID=2833577 RepID=UPI001BC9683C|nr:ribokinase [Bacillus sp. FJAT-50079]MBS4210494.1 ribokinase [Bacillus sp. FJAT-50079]
MKEILVVGSINMDVVNKVDKHPLPGQTIHGKGVQYIPGGKGANQAVAARRLGGNVTMIGAVGTDIFGLELINSLKENKVNIENILIKESTSGLAFITVDTKGENSIILSKGANGLLDKSDMKSLLDVLSHTHIVLLQNEIQWEVNQYVINEANRRGIHVFFNPAPAFEVPDDILSRIDVLIVNETEAEAITGLNITTRSDAEKAADLLIQAKVRQVLITMGEQGAYFAGADGKTVFTPAFNVKAVDTTAAGDTFIGAFSVAFSLGKSIEDCLLFASAASAITVTRFGAQSSTPSEEEIAHFLLEHKSNQVYL